MSSGSQQAIREPNQASGVRKVQYTLYYVRKLFILLARTGVRKMSSVACGLCPVKIHFSDYQKDSISIINESIAIFN